jgi:hypothetical protein
MTLSERLRKYADGELQLGYGAELAMLTEAADLLDATTPRPWPPTEGVKKCLAWRTEAEGWVVAEQGTSALDGSLFWWSEQIDRLSRNPPKFWKPMPPDPEVGP